MCKKADTESLINHDCPIEIITNKIYKKKNISGHKNMNSKYGCFDAKFECLLKGVKIHLPSTL